jgi:hypothetical protein
MISILGKSKTFEERNKIKKNILILKIIFMFLDECCCGFLLIVIDVVNFGLQNISATPKYYCMHDFCCAKITSLFRNYFQKNILHLDKTDILPRS